MNSHLTEEQLFEQQLQRDEEAIMNGTFQGRVNHIISNNASLTDRLKYQLCQRIVAYSQDHELTEEELADKLNLDIEKTRDILYGYVNYLELDDLAKKVDKLLNFRNKKYYYSCLFPRSKTDKFQPAYA